MATDQLVEQATDLANRALELSRDLAALAGEAGQIAADTAAAGGADGASPLVVGLTVFVLAIFVGYHVVWSVTPALHSPLMGVTNAISSVIIVGALIAAGTGEFGFSETMGFIAVTLASVNIFGGFIVTYRMLSMFKKKPKAASGGRAH
ncbi:NAD(P) transhydrogenase subunit alpha [Algihabitans albus]|uniref:NAD(P) transhydrogenase subunit alpha n=1 Tax=Algihabitans albus TaxID=2164067 RepID=UPI000E5CB22C|nr:NAD(P) transhydrogenase subunit alpha [Algihabitans albus]